MNSPQKITALLRELVSNNLPTHALLIHAEPPTPLASIAATLLTTWCQIQETQANPIHIHAHPDIIDITSDTTIKNEHIKKIQEITKYGPQFLKRQFIIIHQAETLTTQASNALLKTLETPPQNVCFILLTHSLSKMLPTIVSRCQTMYCPKFTHDTIEKHPTSLNEVLNMSIPQRLLVAEKISQQKDTLVPVLTQWLEESMNLPTTQTPSIQTLLETIHRLSYNVNTRLQIENTLIRLGGQNQ